MQQFSQKVENPIQIIQTYFGELSDMIKVVQVLGYK